MRRSPVWIGILLLGLSTVLSGCNMLNSLQAPDDKAITADIQAKLFQDPVLKTRDIQVNSQKGVVVLTGSVASDLEKASAEHMAQEAKGVKQVINQLQVAPESAAAAPPAEAAPPAASAAPPAAERPSPERRRREARRAAATPAPAQAAPSSAPAAPAPPPATTPATTAQAQPAAPPPPVQVTIPPGTNITVRMIDGVDSARNRPGEEFAASVDQPVVVDNQVIIPRGSDARVRLAQARQVGKMTGSSQLQVELVSVSVNGTSYPVQTDVIEKTGASRGKRTAETVGGGAALGALIGAIAGKGKGAAIGAAIGAGGGTAVQMATKGEQVKIPSESRVEFTLKSPLTVSM